jgi:hypothetical protein
MEWWFTNNNNSSLTTSTPLTTQYYFEIHALTLSTTCATTLVFRAPMTSDLEGICCNHEITADKVYCFAAAVNNTMLTFDSSSTPPRIFRHPESIPRDGNLWVSYIGSLGSLESLLNILSNHLHTQVSLLISLSLLLSLSLRFRELDVPPIMHSPYIQ